MRGVGVAGWVGCCWGWGRRWGEGVDGLGCGGRGVCVAVVGEGGRGGVLGRKRWVRDFAFLALWQRRKRRKSGIG